MVAVWIAVLAYAADLTIKCVQHMHRSAGWSFSYGSMAVICYISDQKLYLVHMLGILCGCNSYGIWDTHKYKVLTLQYFFSCRKLSKLMELQNCDTDLKDAALSDYYTSGLWWGKEKGYSVQQLSGFFTVLHTLMENIKGNAFKMVSVIDK